MTDIQIFKNEQFGEVRTIAKDGEPWFVAKDVCEALDLGNSRQAVSRLDEDEKGVILTDTLGGNQQVGVVSEAGLYTLVLGSRKPEAKAFKRWITHEVIPTIRRHGDHHREHNRRPGERHKAAASTESGAGAPQGGGGHSRGAAPEGAFRRCGSGKRQQHFGRGAG